MRDKRSRLVPALMLAICSVLPQRVVALDLGLALPSALRVSTGVDDEGSYSYFLDLDQALPGGQRLLFTYGSSRFVGSEDDVTPDTVALGVSSDPLDLITVAVRVEDWGQDDEIKTRTLQGDARLRLDSWWLSLGARMRSIELFLLRTLPEPIGDSININSEGLDLGAGVNITERLSAAVGYFRNDYSPDPGFLAPENPPNDRARITSSVAFSLAAGLQREGGSLATTYFTDWGAAGFDLSQSVSAIDDARSVVVSVGLDIDLSQAVLLQLTGGQQSTENEPDLYLGSAALLFSW